MGGAVSFLPERLTEQQVKNLAGDQFDTVKFDSLKDNNGTISKEDLITASRTHEDKAYVQFMKFCPNGEMDSKTFVKMCKDTDLIDLQLRTGDADIIFASAKNKNGVVSKTINFEVFMSSVVPAIATKKHMTEVEVMHQLYNSAGPTYNATVAESVRLFDDQSTYTGTQHRRLSADQSPERLGSSPNIVLDPTVRRESMDRRPSVSAHPAVLIDFNAPGETETQVQFIKFCPEGDMDSKTFVKLCRDTGLLDATFRQEDADIVYQKGKAFITQRQGFAAKGIKYTVFRQVCIPAIAAKKDISERDVLVTIGQGQGPTYNATVAEAVRLHDDVSTYPSTQQHRLSVSTGIEIIGANDTGGSDGTADNEKADAVEVPIDQNGVGEREAKAQFSLFCPEGDMDSKTFVKLCRDTGLLDSTFRQEDADIVYQKGKTHAAQKQGFPAKTIRYNVFRQVCVPVVAAKKGVTEAELLVAIGQGQGPSYNATVAEPVRLYDDTTTYTGVHVKAAERRQSVDGNAPSGPAPRKSLGGAAPGTDRPNSRLASSRRGSREEAGAAAGSSTTPGRRMSVGNGNMAVSTSADILKPGEVPVRRSSQDLYMGRSVQSREGGRRPSNAAASPEDAASPNKKPPLDMGGKRRNSRRGSDANPKPEELYVPSESSLRFVKAAYLKFAPDGEMSSTQFIKMMREAQLLTKVYNTVEAEIIYMEAKQKAASQGLSLGASTHLTYDVFYQICVPAIAKKRGDSLETFIAILSGIEDMYKVLATENP